MSRTRIKDCLAVADNLDQELYSRIEKTHEGDTERRRDGKTISKTQAILLASIRDTAEQKDLAKNILSSWSDRVRDHSKFIAKYKKLKN